ncbi:MAG: hypothetical protein ACW986_14465 [Promethearchaeota archaeon]
MEGRFKEGKAKPWQLWFANEENVKKYQEIFPEGVKFLGAYLTILGSADHDHETWFEIDKWETLDRWRELAQDPSSNYSKFIQEFVNELGIVNEWTNGKFLRPAGQVKIFEPSK